MSGWRIRTWGFRSPRLRLKRSRAARPVFPVRLKAGGHPIGKPVIGAGIAEQIERHQLRDVLAGQVGIEIVLEYEDGSTESRFIDLY